MIVVSDTTPLNYLVLIGAIEVLPKLFTQVIAPSTVLKELADVRAPGPVRKWVELTPSWLIVADPNSRLPSTVQLDAGEADAISLAKERGIQDVLIDEYLGRKIAMAEGLYALPTLAVLEKAAAAGLLELRPTIEALRRTTYRIREELIIAALERDAARKAAENG